jgi:hypothetical protein
MPSHTQRRKGIGQRIWAGGKPKPSTLKATKDAVNEVKIVSFVALSRGWV